MPYDFDPGYNSSPFRTLVREHPGADVYPAEHFRLEWGPIFHRGRLTGSARVLVIGQDPAAHESVARRILIGEAGRRVQGFLAKLGITRRYVMINTFLYSVYGNIPNTAKRNPELIAYRNRWIDALMAPGRIEAVITFGSTAREAWEDWKNTAGGQTSNVPHVAVTHPTQPESSANGNEAALTEATRRLLHGWNEALQQLVGSIAHPDRSIPLVLYGDTWADGDRVPIPSADLPAGMPTWMATDDEWAQRTGSNAATKRRTITITVPSTFPLP